MKKWFALSFIGCLMFSFSGASSDSVHGQQVNAAVKAIQLETIQVDVEPFSDYDGKDPLLSGVLLTLVATLFISALVSQFDAGRVIRRVAFLLAVYFQSNYVASSRF